MKVRQLAFRVFFYLLGLLLMAFGVAFSVNSNLGVSPINALPYVLSLLVGIDMGACVVAVFSVYVLVQILILRRKFRWINLTQILFSSAFGAFVNFAKSVLGGFALPSYAGQLVMLAISIVLVACGVSLYMSVRLMNMPMEGMTAAIAQMLPKYSFHSVKIVIDCTVTALAAMLSLAFLHQLVGVREGTVLCALLVGMVLKVIQKHLRPVVERLCFSKIEHSECNSAL